MKTATIMQKTKAAKQLKVLRHLSLLAICLCMLGLSGCTYKLGDFNVVSNANMNLSNGSFVIGEKVTGEDAAIVIFYPIKSTSIEDAMDDALAKAAMPTCAVGLTNTAIKYFSKEFMFGKVGYLVEGRVIYDTKIRGCSGVTSAKMIALAKEKAAKEAAKKADKKANKKAKKDKKKDKKTDNSADKKGVDKETKK